MSHETDEKTAAGEAHEDGSDGQRRRAFIKRLAKGAAIAPVATLLYDASTNSVAHAVGT